MENKENQINVNLQDQDGQLMTEQDFYLSEFYKLREEKKVMDKKNKEVSNWLKDYLAALNTEELENDDFILKVSTSTATEIDASELMRELKINIPKEAEELIDTLFKVNLTEAKKMMGALALNKMMTPGTITTKLLIKQKK